MTDNEINQAITDLCAIPRLFVIRKPRHDPFGYYRENARGYTGNVAEAWKVTEEEASKYVTGPAYENEPDKVIMEPAPVTNYCGDLNAMKLAEDTLTDREFEDYQTILQEGEHPFESMWRRRRNACSAASRHRAQAFIFIKTKMKTKPKLPKPLTQARLASLSNDLSEGIVSGTRYEWRQVAKHFRDELDRLHNETTRLRDAVAAVTIAEEMRVAGMSELRQWQARHKGKQ